MGYDEYYAGSPEAVLSISYNYVKEGIEETLKEVPAKKVISGIPFFTRLWKETPKTEEELASEKGTDAAEYSVNVESVAYGMDNAQAQIKQAGVETTWDKEGRTELCNMGSRRSKIRDLAGRCQIHRTKT